MVAAERYFSRGRLVSGRDRQGRLIAADSWLLALQLLSPSDSRRAPIVERLASLLNDYGSVSMPSSQRLFLMEELIALEPSVVLPTLSAERLAAEYLQADGRAPDSDALELSRAPGVWKLRLPGGVALFTADTVVTAARRVIEAQGIATGARFELLVPGRPAGDGAVAASAILPGWQLSFSLTDPEQMMAAARGRAQTYLWAGSAAIAILAAAGLLLWQSFRRQSRVARLKTDLVAAVSHELKTPLASVRLLVDSLLDDEELDTKKTRDYLTLISGENARLSRLIEHVLTFSRLERNRQPFARADVEPAAVVGAAVGVVRDRFEASRADLAVDVAPNLPAIVGDEDALVTVLLNLLENAHTYTGPEKRIALHAYQDAGHVVFEVQDNGIGISRRDQKRVFRRFYQVDRRLSREHGGCGLGLSIVDFIVRAHGGAVRLSSQPGAGSTFRIHIPCRSSNQGAAA
jgi:signal transduction histidine kinase